MRTFQVGFALATALFAPGYCYAQQLWGGAFVKMGIEEVLKAVPGSYRVDSPQRHRDMQAYVVKENVKQDGMTYVAKFYFRRGGLQEVVLLSTEPLPYPEARKRLQLAVDGLRKRHGPEVRHDTFTAPPKPADAERFLWNFGMTEMDAYAMQQPDRQQAEVGIVHRLRPLPPEPGPPPR